jgi:hypothetical protein
MCDPTIASETKQRNVSPPFWIMNGSLSSKSPSPLYRRSLQPHRPHHRALLNFRPSLSTLRHCQLISYLIEDQTSLLPLPPSRTFSRTRSSLSFARRSETLLLSPPNMAPLLLPLWCRCLPPFPEHTDTILASYNCYLLSFTQEICHRHKISSNIQETLVLTPHLCIFSESLSLPLSVSLPLSPSLSFFSLSLTLSLSLVFLLFPPREGCLHGIHSVLL